MVLPNTKQAVWINFSEDSLLVNIESLRGNLTFRALRYLLKSF